MRTRQVSGEWVSVGCAKDWPTRQVLVGERLAYWVGVGDNLPTIY